MMAISKVNLIDNNNSKLKRHKGAKTLSFFCKNRPILINKNNIEEMKTLSKKNDHSNLRICLHSSPSDDHHDMIILETCGKYYRPHKHNGKGECFHLIEGELGIIIFDTKGKILDFNILYPGEIYRIEKEMYLAIYPITSYVIYHENKPGPFLGDNDSIYPDWAPEQNDTVKIEKYYHKIKIYINKLQKVPNDTK